MSHSIIEVENLSKIYRLGVVGATTLAEDLRRLGKKLRGEQGAPDLNEFWALRDVSFNVQPGEVVGIIGRNGAGKSTLLKILSRITEPTSGRVRLRGRVASLLEVGTGFHPDLTGRENVFLNGAILGMKHVEIAVKFDEIVAFAEVEKFIDTPVKHYSSGMRVRLAFAVAAHLDPEILIIDEVLAVGDAEFQKKCLAKIQSVGADGRTVLFISHNMSAVQHLCTRCIHLHHGVVKKIGTPADVVADHLAEAAPATNLDLSQWQDRTGSGEARVVRLRITDEAGNTTSVVPLGSALGFEMDLEFREAVTDPCIGVVIHDSLGEPLLELQSAHTGLKTGLVQGVLRVEGRLTAVSLYPGHYLVSPWITDAAVQRSIDFVKMCCSFQVLAKPGPFGDMRLDPRWGKYWAASTWRTTSGR